MMLNALLIKEIGEPDELEAYFLQALYWSVGGALLEDGRAKFDTYTKYLASATMLQDEGAAAGPGMACLTHVKRIDFFFSASNPPDNDHPSFLTRTRLCLGITPD